MRSLLLTQGNGFGLAQDATYTSEVTNHESRITNHKSQITNHLDAWSEASSSDVVCVRVVREGRANITASWQAAAVRTQRRSASGQPPHPTVRIVTNA